MKCECINLFLASTVAVFEKVFDCEFIRGTPYRKRNTQLEHEIGGAVHCSGKFSGLIILSLSRELALRATELLNRERPAEINVEVVDTIGKLVTAIVRGIQARFEDLEMEVSLPPRIVMKYRSLEFPPDTKALCVPFESEWGSITVVVGVSETVSSAA